MKLISDLEYATHKTPSHETNNRVLMVIHPETLFISKGFDVFPSSHEKLFGSHETYYSESFTHLLPFKGSYKGGIGVIYGTML